MYAGAGRAGDFAGDPLLTVASHYLVWIGAGRLQIRAVWTTAPGLPAHAWITYLDGVIQGRDVTPPVLFDLPAAGQLPALAAVAVAAEAYDADYDPLGGRDDANLTTFRGLDVLRLRGLYRSENTDLDRYELFKGEGAEPDLNAAPWQTFTSLPFDTPALTNSVTTYLVLRYRNRYNLSSQNVLSETFTLDGSGALIRNPSAPVEIRVEQAAGGAARIRAWYDYLADAPGVRADTWAVWITTDGSTPNPANPATYTEAMNLADVDAKLDYTSATAAHGATVKVLVRTRRSGAGGADSINSTVYTITADAQGPAAPENGQAFFGRVARQV